MDDKNLSGFPVNNNTNSNPPNIPPSFEDAPTVIDPNRIVNAQPPVSLKKPAESAVPQNSNPAPIPPQNRQNPKAAPTPPQNRQQGNIKPNNMNNSNFPNKMPLNNQGTINANEPKLNVPPPINGTLQPPQNQKKKSGCLIPVVIVIIVIIILVLIVGGVVAFLFLKSDDKNDDSSSSKSSSVSDIYENSSASDTDYSSGAESESSAGRAESTAEPTTESKPDVDYKKLYAKIVGDVFNSGKNLWGEDLYSVSENEFAVYDVDGDGREELIFFITSTYTGGMTMTIYDYNDKGETYEQFTAFPYVTFYDNGVIWAGISHNQGLAGDFWPHTLYSYNAETDTYKDEGYVDAWSKESFPTDFSDEPFPDYIDKSKSGYVYYIYPPNNSGDVKPVDEAEYLKWSNAIIGNAKELNIPFMNLTESNIQTLDPTFTDTSGRPPEGDRELAPDDMVIGEYLGSGKTIKKATMYMGPATEYDAIISIPDDSYLSIYGYNKKWCYASYSGSSYTYSGYVKVEDIESELFGGAKGKLKINTEKDPLNMRSTASMDGKIVGKIPKGEIVSYYEIKDGWYKVKYDGKEGYVSGDYVLVQQ